MHAALKTTGKILRTATEETRRKDIYSDWICAFYSADHALLQFVTAARNGEQVRQTLLAFLQRNFSFHIGMHAL